MNSRNKKTAARLCALVGDGELGKEYLAVIEGECDGGRMSDYLLKIAAVKKALGGKLHVGAGTVITMEQFEMAKNAGMSVCTLGRRILRCETAPLCALSAVMYHVGEF